MNFSKEVVCSPLVLQKDRYLSLQFLLEENDEGISASFLYVGFLDLFNRVELLLSLLVADGCSELCLASRGQSEFG